MTVAVVEGLDCEANEMEGVDDVQEEKAYPELGLALIASNPPELTHVLDPTAGDVVPPAVAAIVTWYWAEYAMACVV